ncbi:hypothetical protein C0995_010733 [Termitomyces sp. Mi166|nr:hypothetical protein C0995_010733 [Termitomyces sp. Mi166\
MRTPSLYSQDDPLATVMRPSSTETDAQRRARLAAEAEARRVSEQIDEELRQERERMKRNKGDVKLLLLGQAESGKSTLQKQFQLMYKPNSIDQERVSWKTVIYFNVVHSLKHILATLEAWDDILDDELLEDSSSVALNRLRTKDNAQQPSPSVSLISTSTAPSALSASPASTVNSTRQASVSREQIGNLRRRLTSIIATDAPLADRLSGGLSFSGSGKGGVYVRSGWQARTIENALGRLRTHHDIEFKKSREAYYDPGQDVLVQDVGRMLSNSKDDIKELWGHPTVKGLIARRKLKLDEWSEL